MTHTVQPTGPRAPTWPSRCAPSADFWQTTCRNSLRARAVDFTWPQEDRICCGGAVHTCWCHICSTPTPRARAAAAESLTRRGCVPRPWGHADRPPEDLCSPAPRMPHRCGLWRAGRVLHHQVRVLHHWGRLREWTRGLEHHRRVGVSITYELNGEGREPRREG